MEMIGDPETYENSQIVEKSSKSGIFSNKRLLVVKSGYLYYFTNVPSEYKSHLPNLLASFKELPKCSIEIGKIYTIKLESAKSSNLIINFYEKDMIDREDIRKTIEVSDFKPKKPTHSELEEWKFTFSTVLQCRLWYSALVRLKQHFLKQANKIEDFMNNFNPARRASTAQISSSNKSSSPTQRLSLDSKLVPEGALEEKQKEYSSQIKLQTILEDECQAHSVSEARESSVRSVKVKSVQEQSVELKANEILDHFAEPLDVQHLRQVDEEKEKLKKQCQTVRKQLSEKDSIIIDLERKLEQVEQQRISDIKQMNAQREQELSEQYLQEVPQEMAKGGFQKNKVPPPEVKESSIQTEEEMANQSFTMTPLKSRFSLNQSRERDTLPFFRNTMSNLSYREAEAPIYGYYEQMGKLFGSASFAERLEKEALMVQHCQRMKINAMRNVEAYLDDHRPTCSARVERGIFIYDIVCEPGKVLNIYGKEQLVYGNKQHQSLKRLFKIYSHLNDQIIQIIKKKPTYPVRVPLCCLIEYRGYTVLVSQPPTATPIPLPSHLQSLITHYGAEKFVASRIQNKKIPLILLECKEPFKITDTEALPHFTEPVYSSDFLAVNRGRNISLSSTNLQQHLGGGRTEKMNVVRSIMLCRKLKKVMKSVEPYSQQKSSCEFFLHFLRSPQEILSLMGETNFQRTGLFLHVAEQLLGIRLTSETTVEVTAVGRCFGLTPLNVLAVAAATDQYLAEDRLESAEHSLSYMWKVAEREVQAGIRESELLSKYRFYEQALEKVEQLLPKSNRMQRIELTGIKVKCSRMLGHQMELLIGLRELLEELECNFPNSVYALDAKLLIAESMARQGALQKAVEVYRHVVSANIHYRPSVFLSLSRELMHKGLDPNALVQFMNTLHQTAPEENANVDVHLGQLYIRIGNPDKAAHYLERGFLFFLQHTQDYSSLCNSFQLLIPLLHSSEKKKSVHRKLLIKLKEGKNLREELVVSVNTAVVIDLLEHHTREGKEKLLQLLQGQDTDGKVQFGDYERIEGLLNKVCTSNELLPEEDFLLIKRINGKAIEQVVNASVKFL